MANLKKNFKFGIEGLPLVNQLDVTVSSQAAEIMSVI